ncbi:unnamed protein product, partial [Polarella glacialis]
VHKHRCLHSCTFLVLAVVIIGIEISKDYNTLLPSWDSKWFFFLFNLLRVLDAYLEEVRLRKSYSASRTV